jgi:hypothetical protein
MFIVFSARLYFSGLRDFLASMAVLKSGKIVNFIRPEVGELNIQGLFLV